MRINDLLVREEYRIDYEIMTPQEKSFLSNLVRFFLIYSIILRPNYTAEKSNRSSRFDATELENKNKKKMKLPISISNVSLFFIFSPSNSK